MKAMVATIFLIMTTCVSLADEECRYEESTYHEGLDLAREMIISVARVSTPNSDNHGFGVVIAGHRDDTFVATVAHVVGNEAMRVVYCADAEGRSYHATEEFVSADGYLSVLRVAGHADIKFPKRTIDSPDESSNGSDIWFIGLQQQCVAGGETGTLSDVLTGESIVSGNFRSVTPGSSGGPVLTVRGMIGLMEDVQDVSPMSKQVTISRLDTLAAEFAATTATDWILRSSCNFPPGNWIEAKRELSDKVQRYMFNLNNIIIRFQEKNINTDARGATISKYSNAWLELYAIRNDYIATIRQTWGDESVSSFKALLSDTMELHLRFIDLNKYDLYQVKGLPRPVVAFVKDVTPHARELEARWSGFLQRLEKPDE